MNDSVSAAQRVAAFLLSLSKEDAARVMRHLDSEVVADVAAAMTELDPELCSTEAVDGVYHDIARAAYGDTTVRSQDDRELTEILRGTFGEAEAERVLSGIHERRREAHPFLFLDRHPPDVVAKVLAEEAPGVVALVLAHVPPGLSAEVLSLLEEDKGLAVVKRMTAIRPPGTETLLTIADDLEERVRSASMLQPAPDPTSGLRTVADLLNYAQSETERAVLEGLERDDQEVAEQVRELMFTWEDLAGIEKRAMQKILATVDTRTLSMALKASSAEVQANVMGNLSARVREMVTDERELLGAVPMAEVLTARAEIMTAVRGLMDSGEFSPSRAGEELVT